MLRDEALGGEARGEVGRGRGRSRRPGGAGGEAVGLDHERADVDEHARPGGERQQLAQRPADDVRAAPDGCGPSELSPSRVAGSLLRGHAGAEPPPERTMAAVNGTANASRQSTSATSPIIGMPATQAPGWPRSVHARTRGRSLGCRPFGGRGEPAAEDEGESGAQRASEPPRARRSSARPSWQGAGRERGETPVRRRRTPILWRKAIGDRAPPPREAGHAAELAAGRRRDAELLGQLRQDRSDGQKGGLDGEQAGEQKRRGAGPGDAAGCDHTAIARARGWPPVGTR